MDLTGPPEISALNIDTFEQKVLTMTTVEEIKCLHTLSVMLALNS